MRVSVYSFTTTVTMLVLDEVAVSVALAQAVTVHHGHMPEIELTSPITATGIWAMFDIVQSPRLNFRGYGH